MINYPRKLGHDGRPLTFTKVGDGHRQVILSPWARVMIDDEAHYAYLDLQGEPAELELAHGVVYVPYDGLAVFRQTMPTPTTNEATAAEVVAAVAKRLRPRWRYIRATLDHRADAPMAWEAIDVFGRINGVGASPLFT